MFSYILYFISVVKDCGPVPTVEHSIYQSNETTVGATVVYTCHTGYEIINGSATLTCQESGVWSTDKPFCASK